jgi:hypothetical protein
MSTIGGPATVTSGLVLELDAGNIKSYPTTGTTWFDKSGNANNGTLINGPTFNTGSLGSIVFDGVDDYARFRSGLYGQTSFSFEFWFNQTSIQAFSQEIFTSDYTPSGNTSNPGIEVYSNGTTLYFRSNYNNNTRPATTTISAGVWQQVVCTCTVNSGITIYLNGVQGTPNTPTNPYITWNNEYLNVAALTGYASLLPFNGRISITRIYNRPLSTSEVQQNFNATRARFGI